MKAPENNNKKGGFLAALSRIFGGSAASGGASAGLGSAASGGASSFFSSAAAGIGGLFATKAGIVGMVLGGATIAAGVGVVYNFVGPSSKPLYSSSLFENQYYESEVANASAKRTADYNADASGSASLDYFRDEAKRDGIGFGDSEEGAEGDIDSASADGADNLASGSADGVASDGDGYYGANASMNNVPRLQKAPGFGSSGGASRSKISFGGAGMSSGIGSKFQKIYKAPTGRASSMKGALASKINKSAKYNLPNFNRKGAYGQAKYAGKLGKKASYADSFVGAKTTAIEAFEGETAGEGDIEAPDMGGEGLGGGGISNGDGLKGSDPSLNSNDSTPPPEPGEPENDSPWQKYVDMVLYGMIAAAALNLLTSVLVNKAKALAAVPATWAAAVTMYKLAKAVASMAMAAAAVVTYAGIMLMRGDPSGDPPWEGQKWQGMMYTAIGAYLLYSSYQALVGINKGIKAAQATGLQYNDAITGLSEAQQANFAKLPGAQQTNLINGGNGAVGTSSSGSFTNTSVGNPVTASSTTGGVTTTTSATTTNVIGANGNSLGTSTTTTTTIGNGTPTATTTTTGTMTKP